MVAPFKSLRARGWRCLTPASCGLSFDMTCAEYMARPPSRTAGTWAAKIAPMLFPPAEPCLKKQIQGVKGLVALR